MSNRYLVHFLRQDIRQSRGFSTQAITSFIFVKDAFDFSRKKDTPHHAYLRRTHHLPASRQQRPNHHHWTEAGAYHRLPACWQGGGRSSVSAGHAQRARMISNHLDGYEQTSQRMLITRTFSTSVLHFPTKAFSPSLFVRVGWPLVPPPLSADRGPYALAPTSK
jgi:hypothetical protein